jgi:hypothetical protein
MKGSCDVASNIARLYTRILAAHPCSCPPSLSPDDIKYLHKYGTCHTGLDESIRAAPLMFQEWVFMDV